MTPRFTSTRERRLWTGAAAVVAAIFASVPFGGVLAGWYGSGILLGVLFAGFFLVTIIAVAGAGLTRDVGRRTRWVGVAVVVSYGMLTVRLGVTPLERTHLFEYGIVAILILEALRARRASGIAGPNASATAIVATTTIGWLDEALQAVIPGRVYDVRDVGTNALAALVAVLAVNGLAWARRRDRDDAPGRSGSGG